MESFKIYHVITLFDFDKKTKKLLKYFLCKLLFNIVFLS